MNLLFFDANFNSLYGAQQSMLALLEGLSHRGIPAVLITTGEGNLAREARKRGVRTVVLPASSRVNVFGGQIRTYSLWRKLITAWDVLAYNRALARWLEGQAYTHIVANDVRSALLIGLAARWQHAMLVWYVRDDTRLGVLHAICGMLAQRIITVSDGVQKVFSERELMRFRHKLRTVYTGLKLEQFNLSRRANAKQQLGIDASSIVLTTIGMMTPRKGQVDFLAVARNLLKDHRDGTTFLIVGSAPEGYKAYQRQIEAEVAALPAAWQERVKLLGWRDDISTILAATDILLHPSRGEGLPRVLLEAMAMSVPVITYNVSGAAEIVVSGENGYIVEIGDTVAMVHHVNEILSSQERLETMRNNARARVEALFTFDRYIDTFLEALEIKE